MRRQTAFALVLALLLALPASTFLPCGPAEAKDPEAAPKFKKILVGKTPLRVEVVETLEKQERGLMFRQSLPENEGMLFVYREPQYQGDAPSQPSAKPKTLGAALKGMVVVLADLKFVFFLIVIGLFWIIYVQIYNLVRGVTHPYPGAFTHLDGRKVIVWSAWPVDGHGEPGRVVSTEPLLVGTGEGLLEIKSLQVKGEEETTANNIALRSDARFS